MNVKPILYLATLAFAFDVQAAASTLANDPSKKPAQHAPANDWGKQRPEYAPANARTENSVQGGVARGTRTTPAPATWHDPTARPASKSANDEVKQDGKKEWE